MAQTNYQGMGLYPMQEDRPPESFRDAMSKKMGLLQLGTGEVPMLRGTKEGVGLYAGGGGTEPVYSGETGKPYYVASAQPVAAPTAPEAPLGTAEWVEQEFKKKKEGYAQALKNQRLIVEKGKELGLPLDKVEAALKTKNLLKLKEPELSEPMLKILEEERKTKAGGGRSSFEMQTFEATEGFTPAQRGTPEYGEKFKEWKKEKTALTQNVVLPTSEGYVVVNKVTSEQVNTGLTKPLTGAMIDTEQQLGTIKGTFDRVKNLYKPEYTGAIGGRIGGLRSVTIGNPAERAVFQSALQDINNSIVYLKSGKQINEQEYARLKAAMPHKNLADSDFKARIEEFDRVLNSIIEERRKAKGGWAGQTPSAPAEQGRTITVTNPDTGESETWDLNTEMRVK